MKLSNNISQECSLIDQQKINKKVQANVKLQLID